LKNTSLGPLRQGQRLDTSETKLKQRAQTTKPKLEQPQRAPPAHMQAPPEPMQLPLNECMQDTTWNRAAATTHLSPVRPATTTGQTGAQHVHRTSTLTCQTGNLDWSDRCTTRAQKWLETTWKPSKCIQQAISSSNFSPLLAMHESSQKCNTFNLELLKWTKFNKGCYTCPNEQVRYSIASCWHQLQDHQVSQPLDEAKMDLGNFAKNFASHEQSPKHDQNILK
jgi:hypothetical protein